MNNADMPVTPIVGSNGRVQPFTDDNGFSAMATGLTKREAFAMAAMQGICSSGEYIPTEQHHYDNVATDAIRQADALLKELSK